MFEEVIRVLVLKYDLTESVWSEKHSLFCVTDKELEYKRIALAAALIS